MDPCQVYAAGLEQILKNSYLELKETVAHFEEICHQVSPHKSPPHDVIVGIRRTYREIQDQLTKVKGIQQLLEGKYRSFYRRNPQREREIVEFALLAKNAYLRVEYTLKEIEAKRKLREQEKRMQEYGWFRSAENEAALLRTLQGLERKRDGFLGHPWPEERRKIARGHPISLSLFLLSGDVDLMDLLEGKIALREHDLIERYGPDEFRGALAHFREIAAQEVENVLRRIVCSRGHLETKGLLFPVRSRSDLRKEALVSIRRLLKEVQAGEVKWISL